MSPNSPFSDLTVVFRNLRHGLGLWCGRGVLAHALGLLLWARFAGVSLKMERLAARFAAGRLWRVADRTQGSGTGLDRPACRDASKALPARFGWLVWQVGWQAAGFGSQLRAVLQTPDMVALLEACPQAGRILRPVCRMLAVDTSLLRLPKSVAVGVPHSALSQIEVEVVAKPRKPSRKVVEPWRVPLPRGVLAAARRQGYGRIPPTPEKAG